ncbi:MAG: hypothetical protein R3A10_10575 [Caldilineaceae bacterium]
MLIYLYQTAWRFYRMGYGSTIAIGLAMVILFLHLVQLRAFRHKRRRRLSVAVMAVRRKQRGSLPSGTWTQTLERGLWRRQYPMPISPPRNGVQLCAKTSGGRVLTYVILIALAVLVGFPFYWMMVLSFTPESQIYTRLIEFIPSTVTLDNYHAIFTFGRTCRSCAGSQQRRHRRRGDTVVATVCSMAAYGFARLTFPGGDTLFFFAALCAQGFPPR